MVNETPILPTKVGKISNDRHLSIRLLSLSLLFFLKFRIINKTGIKVSSESMTKTQGT